MSLEDTSADEALDRAVRAFREMESADAPPAELSQSVVQRLQQSQVSPPSAIWSTLSNHPRQVIALGGAVAAVLLGFFLWPDSFEGGSAVAAVQDAVRRAESVQFTVVTSVGGQPDESTRVVVAGSDRMRVDYPRGEVLTVDCGRERQMRLIPETKHAVIRSAFRMPERLSPLHELLSLSDKAVEPLPARTVDGEESIGFVIRGGGYTELSVWVNRRTKLPVRMESTWRDNSGNMVREVTRDFVYDGEIDNSLFITVAPDGYRVDEKLVSRADLDPQAFTVKPRVGVGPLEFGMTKDDVINLLGEPNAVKRDFGRDALDYPSLGLKLEFRGDDGLVMIHCLSQLAHGFDVRDFAGRTDEGISIGSSPGDVRAAYGERDHEFNPENGVLMYGKLGATFQFRKGKLSEITLAVP